MTFNLMAQRKSNQLRRRDFRRRLPGRRSATGHVCSIRGAVKCNSLKVDEIASGSLETLSSHKLGDRKSTACEDDGSAGGAGAWQSNL